MKKFIIPVCVLALALFLLVAIRGHWDSWKSDGVLQKTNDAYVTANQRITYSYGGHILDDKHIW